MAFRLSMLLGVDADQAKAELGQTKQAIDKTKTAAKGLNTDGRAAAQGVNALGRAADGTEAQMLQLAEAERRAAREAQGVARGGNLAAGGMGNLIAQFNDIGVMMMAGQNPLQLAVQQGTQISQVIGPMGATGAARALGSAFIGMLNPISLITIGSIAAGAAMSNWLFGAKEDAVELEDTLDLMADAIEAFDQRAQNATLSTTEMFEKFGTASPVMRAVLADMVALSKIDAYQAIDQTSESIRNLVLDLAWWDDRSSRSASQDFLGLGNMSSAARTAGSEFARNLDLLRQSEEPADKLQAALDLREQLLGAAGGVESLNGEQRRFYEGLIAIIRDLELMGAKVREAEQAMAKMPQSLSGLQDVLGVLQSQQEASSDWAQEQVESLEQQGRMAALVVQYGADSLEVAEARLDAEREKQEELVRSRSLAEDEKDELMAAWDAANGIGDTDMATAIREARIEAGMLARNLALAQRGQDILNAARNNPDFYDPRNESGLAGETDPNRYDIPLTLPDVDMPPNPRPRKGSRGGRASSTDREREAVERLLEREREQLEVMRETDSLQQELIRNREILASATDGERAAIEEVIRARLSEQEALDQSRERMGFYRDMIDSAIMRSENLGDVLRNTLLPALWEAAMWGDGPLGSLFGGGSLLGMIFPGVDKKADGGYITGAGGVRDDRVPILGSAGEFMVNGAATARHRHLLEHLNSGGDLRGYADGGMIGGAGRGAASMGAGASGAQDVLRVELADGLRASLLQESQQRTIQILDEYSRSTAPDIARAAMQDIRSQNK